MSAVIGGSAGSDAAALMGDLRRHDMIVLGAGHNGLVAANYLADSGLDVLVVDARETVGGMTSSDYAIPAAPEHLINHCAVDPMLWSPGPPARELGLETHGLKMIELDPAFAYLHPDGASIAFWRDPTRTAEEIRRFSRADAAAFLKFAGFLLPPGTLPDELEHRARAIPANGSGWGQMKIDIACSARIDLSRHQKERSDDLDLRLPSHWIGTEEGIERAYAASAAGIMPAPEDLVFYNAVPNAADPSQTPDGQDALYMLAVAVPFAPPEGWNRIKDDAAATVVARAQEFYGGLTEMELGRRVDTHEDIGALMHVSGGCHPHVDQVLSRSGPLRPALGLGAYRTPVKQLYLGGSGSHPGGSVTGLPGYLGAKTALRGIEKEQATL